MCTFVRNNWRRLLAAALPPTGGPARAEDLYIIYGSAAELATEVGDTQNQMGGPYGDLDIKIVAPNSGIAAREAFCRVAESARNWLACELAACKNADCNIAASKSLDPRAGLVEQVTIGIYTVRRYEVFFPGGAAAALTTSVTHSVTLSAAGRVVLDLQFSTVDAAEASTLAALEVPPRLLNPRDGRPVRMRPLLGWGPCVYAIDAESQRRLAATRAAWKLQKLRECLAAAAPIVDSLRRAAARGEVAPADFEPLLDFTVKETELVLQAQAQAPQTVACATTLAATALADIALADTTLADIALAAQLEKEEARKRQLCAERLREEKRRASEAKELARLEAAAAAASAAAAAAAAAAALAAAAEAAAAEAADEKERDAAARAAATQRALEAADREAAQLANLIALHSDLAAARGAGALEGAGARGAGALDCSRLFKKRLKLAVDNYANLDGHAVAAPLLAEIRQWRELAAAASAPAKIAKKRPPPEAAQTLAQQIIADLRAGGFRGEAGSLVVEAARPNDGAARPLIVDTGERDRPRSCDGCGQRLTVRILECTCRAAAYCDSACQKADWRAHKPFHVDVCAAAAAAHPARLPPGDAPLLKAALQVARALLASLASLANANEANANEANANEANANKANKANKANEAKAANEALAEVALALLRALAARQDELYAQIAGEFTSAHLRVLHSAAICATHMDARRAQGCPRAAQIDCLGRGFAELYQAAFAGRPVSEVGAPADLGEWARQTPGAHFARQCARLAAPSEP